MPFVSNVAFRSPPPLPTQPLPTPTLPQAQNAEEDAEEALTDGQTNTTIIGLINQRVTRSRATATSNRAEV